jgi:hypothetical protein
MLNLFNYFENVISLFEEEDIVDLDINKDVKFEDFNKFLDTKLSDLRDGGCYEHGQDSFTIKIKNPDNNSYYFYNFYYTGGQEIKLVFGICTAYTKNGNNITLNNISEKQLKEDLSEITLKDIYESHNASVKIDIPIRVRNIFFNAILSFILKYSLINKQITYRGHLEPSEIPFAKLAVDVNRENLELEPLKKMILKNLSIGKEYSTKALKDINSYIKEKKINIKDKEIKLNKEMIDGMLINVNSSIFDNIHGNIRDVTYGKGGISFKSFKEKLVSGKITDIIEFFDFFLEKINFFEDKIKKIKTNDKTNFIKQFNIALIKLRTELFHRDRLYRLIIRRVLKLNTLLKDENIYNMSEHDDKFDIKEIKNKIFNNIIEMLKRKQVQAKVILHNNNGKNQFLQPKNFVLPLYNQKIESDLKDYFDLLEDEMFSTSKLPSTTKMILKDISDFIINSIVINNPTGWVNVNTSSKKFLDFTDEVEVIDDKIFNPRKKKLTKISPQEYRNYLHKRNK